MAKNAMRVINNSVSNSAMRITDRSDESVDVFLTDVRKCSRLTPDEEYAVGVLAHKGDEQAINRLICSNLRLCISAANDWTGKKIPYADLIGAARWGLCRAARQYDPEEGSFSSYARLWMADAIREVVDAYTTISVPVNKAKTVARILRLRGKMMMDTHADHEVSNYEVWDYYVEQRENEGLEPEVTFAEFLATIAAQQEGTRFVSSKDDEDDSPFIVDLVSDGEDAFDAVRAGLRADALHEAISQLDDDDVRRTLLLLFGIGCKERSAEEVASLMGCSSQTVLNRKNRGLKQLRTLLQSSPWVA